VPPDNEMSGGLRVLLIALITIPPVGLSVIVIGAL
jgi:hypothetical protein